MAGLYSIGGMSQMTPAQQTTIRKAAGVGTARARGKKRSKGKKKKPAKPRAKKSAKSRSTGGKKARLVKGSAAAKAYMAKIRKMRKK